MAINVFISYSSADEPALKALEKHLAALKHSGLIEPWSVRQLRPGETVRDVTDRKLERAGLILLLISPHFLHSEELYNVELKRAIDRHHARTARVVPIIIQYVDWRGTLIDGLSVLPEQGCPVSSPDWGHADKAWTNVARHLRTLVEEMLGRTLSYPSPSGKSFVEEHGGRFSMPHSQPAPSSGAPLSRAPSFVAPSSRAPLSQSPSSSRHSARSQPSSRHPTYSQPAISIPVPPRSSQRSAYWPTAPSVARTLAPREPSRLPVLVLGSLVLAAAAGIAAGLWAFNQHADPSPESATALVQPAPSPAPKLNRDPPPAQTPTPVAVAGPCCGGSACEPALQDTRGSMCAKVADHCATCPSFRDRVDGACREPLAPSQRFLLRLARVNLAGMSPSLTQICVRLAGDPAVNRQCTSVAAAGDGHHGIPGAELSTRLWVSTADLIETGRGLDIEVEIAGHPYAARAAAHLKGRTLFRSALCQGVFYDVDAAHISFYLDDM